MRQGIPLAVAQPAPVRAGLIGCGQFGAGILAQAASVPLLEVPVVADTDADAARLAYQRAGVSDGAIQVCDSRARALAAIEAGRRAIVVDPLLLMDLPLEVIVEATGEPEGGARHAEAAIRSGRHVAMVNKEADVAVGPILKRLADQEGVVYTPVDGDQHGLLIALVGWARRLGLDVLCGGKSRDQEIRCDPTLRALSSGSNEIALSPEQYSAFQPLPWGPGGPAVGAGLGWLPTREERLGAWARIGGWDLVELVIAANATGLAPDRPSGVHCPAVYAGEIPHVLCPTEMGGILRTRGAIDAVTCLRLPHEPGLGGGVFLVVTAANPAARAVLSRGGVGHNADGSATLISRPYHLLGVEAIHSILAAARGGAGCAPVDYRPRYDVVARASRDLEAGTVLGGDHSPELEALIAPAAPVAAGRPLPLHLANGNRLVTPVEQGTVIRREMVAAPAGSSLWSLRSRQDACFFSSG
jgi:predicted homoserine dehydrogenase-like protein